MRREERTASVEEDGWWGAWVRHGLCGCDRTSRDKADMQRRRRSAEQDDQQGAHVGVDVAYATSRPRNTAL